MQTATTAPAPPDLREFTAHITDEQKAEWRPLSDAVHKARRARDDVIEQAGYLLMRHHEDGTPTFLEMAHEAARSAVRLETELKEARARLAAHPYDQSLKAYNDAKRAFEARVGP